MVIVLDTRLYNEIETTFFSPRTATLSMLIPPEAMQDNPTRLCIKEQGDRGLF
jgi:hypothetical protein